MHKKTSITASKIKLVIVSNIPVPYRNPILTLLAQYDDIDLTVIYCNTSEPDRNWTTNEALSYKAIYLKKSFITINDRYIHFNFDVWATLRKLSPQVILTTGYNPTHLISFLYARLHKLPHIVMTDGTFKSEQSLQFFHRVVRRIVFSRSVAFVGASEGSLDLFRSYGVSSEKTFKSCLSIDNDYFNNYQHPLASKSDFLFSGRLVERKNPLFCIEVAAMVAKKLGRKVTLAIIGNGPLKEKLISYHQLIGDQVNLEFRGFASQEDLPKHFLSSRIFLFPSSWDPWGIVANEACAASLPVIVSPHAGVAGELVQHDKNGFILPLSVDLWAEAAIKLLQNNKLYGQMSKSSLNAVALYNHADAAKGIADAVQSTITYHPERSEDLRKVVIVQRRLVHYRVALFEQMRVYLRRFGVDLHLVHGQAYFNEARRHDSGKIAWASWASCKYFFKGRICWQNFSEHIKDADLVIVTQENKLIYNLIALFVKRPRRIAFWGHGANFQLQKRSILSAFKDFTTTKVDWWFAYCSLSVRKIEKAGFDPNKITNVKNAIDTKLLAINIANIDEMKIESIRKKYGLISGHTGLFIGSLHKFKLISFMIEAAVAISARHPGFILIIIGDGEECSSVKLAASQHQCIKYVGMKVGNEKAAFLRVADFIMNPGQVGLGLFDGFVAGLPIVTTNCDLHSPEFAYLVNGKNGLISSFSLADYVDHVLMVLEQDSLRHSLSQGALASSKLYSIENMSERFSLGILQCLSEIV